MSAPRTTQLAYPFALVGLVGGAFVGAIPHESWVVHVFAPVTAFVAGALGAFVTRERRRKPPMNAGMGTGAIVVGTLIAGIANGALLVTGIVLFHTPGAFPLALIAGALVGAVFSLPFMPVLAHVAAADQDVGRAREGSLVDRADRRGVWAVCLGWIGASMLLGACNRWSMVHLPSLLAVAAIVFVTIVALALADARAWWRVRRSTDGADFGMGVLERIEHPPRSYRAPPVTSMVVRDASMACAEMERALRRDVLALLVACTGTTLLVLASTITVRTF
jgi:hypothetical protein